MQGTKPYKIWWGYRETFYCKSCFNSQNTVYNSIEFQSSASQHGVATETHIGPPQVPRAATMTHNGLPKEYVAIKKNISQKNTAPNLHGGAVPSIVTGSFFNEREEQEDTV